MCAAKKRGLDIGYYYVILKAGLAKPAGVDFGKGCAPPLHLSLGEVKPLSAENRGEGGEHEGGRRELGVLQDTQA